MPKIRRTYALTAVLALGCLCLTAPAPAVGASGPSANRLVAKAPIAAPKGASDLCARHPWACATANRPPRPTAQMLQIARLINRDVNARTRNLSDNQQYGREEYWALPTARGGDCEDFALEKKRRLIEAGLPPQALLIATVLDRSRNPHAVLVMRTDQGDYVLDNLRSGLSRWHLTGYSFLRMQDPKAPARWQAILAGGIFSKTGT
ncbi:MAG: transglutaminase-like cysteine peptidase [Albidovulum sp.]